MSLRPYPEYRDSGVEWLGEVPAHWGVEPLKRQIDRNDGGVWGDDPDGENDTIVLRSTEQTADGHWQIDDPALRKLNESELAGSLLREGDLLLTKSSGSSLHIGKTTLVTREIAAMRCCYSNFMQRIRMKPAFLPRLAWFVLNNNLARLQFDLLSNSSTGLANLNATMIGQIFVPVPPRPEQVHIAAFLERETAKIDALVAEQQRLVELLKEKRQAVISHAVTKGLNANAPMKDSGIEWPTKVPEHWEVVRLGRRLELQRGVDITKDEQRPGMVPVVSSGGIASFHDEPLVSGPGVVVGRKGTAGAVHWVDSAYWPHDTTLYVKAFHGNHPRFVYYKLSSMDLASYDTGASNPTINRNVIHPVFVPWPPVVEQLQIAAFLDSETAKFEALTAEAQRAIELLQERRTALISAAVTGKIDVRP